MKTKSFLFLIAALAAALTLTGCSSEESTSTTNNVPYDRWNSIQSDVDRINAAFDEGAEVVKLDGDVEFEEGDVLIIPAGKTLNLDAYTLTDDSEAGYVVVKGTILPIEAGKVTLTQSYIIADGSYLTANVGTDSTTLFTVSDAGSAVAYGAVTALVFATDSLDDDQASALGAGSTGVLLGNLNRSAPLNIDTDGHLIVKGNVTLSETGTVSGGGTLSVSGGLTSTVVDTGTGLVLVDGPLTARTITTAGGNFGGSVTIAPPSSIKSVFGGTQTIITSVLATTGPVEFTGAGSFGAPALFGGAADFKGTAEFTEESEFTGAATFGSQAIFTKEGVFTGGAEFKDDVTFTEASAIGGGAKFASGIKVVGEVTVDTLNVGGTLLLGPEGQIIYTSVASSFLNSVGTLAALDGGGTVTFGISTNELAVSGDGTFAVNNVITLANGNTIKVDGTTSVFFNGGSITTGNYQFGGAVGTLATNNTFILGADGIKSDTGKGGSATLTFDVEDDAASIVLNVLESKVLTIDKVNIDLSTHGSISVGGGSASIILTGAGGSISTGEDEDFIAYAGTIYTDYTTGVGSLVAGSAGYGEEAGSILAGSIGTAAGNFITAGGSFAILKVAQEDILKAVGSAGTNPDEVLSGDKGSIAVFQLK